VRIVKETGKPVAQVARDLGISPYTLHNWVKLDRERVGESGALSESEREELARLRRQRAQWEKERADLEMERDVLKRSVVLWVKDSMNR
jgi:transposase